MQVLVLQLIDISAEGGSMDKTLASMRQKGFEVSLRTDVPPVDELRQQLEGTNQLWIISTDKRRLSAQHIASIKAFFDRGRGV